MSEFDRFSNNYKNVLDESIAISGETSEYFTSYKSNYVLRVLGPSRQATILDFGCGIGALSSAMHRILPDAKIDGFDVSKQSIDRIDPQLSGLGRFTSDLSQLDCEYDLIVISNVLHHIRPSSRTETIRELRDRLTNHGKLLIFEHNPINPLTRMVVASCAFDEDAVLLRPHEISDHFIRCHIRKLRTDYIVFFPKFLAFLRPLEPVLSWCPLGAQYAVLGEKGPGKKREKT